MSIDSGNFLTTFLGKVFGQRPTDPKLSAAYDQNLANNPFMKKAGELMLQRAAQSPAEFNKELLAKGATQAQVQSLMDDTAIRKAREDLAIRGIATQQNTNALTTRDTVATDNRIRSALQGQMPIMTSAQDHELRLVDRDNAQAEAYRQFAAQEADKNRALIAQSMPTGAQRFIGTLLQGASALAPLLLLRGLG